MNKPLALPGAFLGKSEKLYIRVSRVQPQGNDLYTTQTAVYSSVESYNSRSERPHYVELSTVADDYLAAVTIDMDTLTIPVDDQQTDG